MHFQITCSNCFFPNFQTPFHMCGMARAPGRIRQILVVFTVPITKEEVYSQKCL